MPATSIQLRRDRKTKPWTVRDADGDRHRSASFRTKADAQLFAAQLRTDQAAGEWISADAGRVPLHELEDLAASLSGLRRDPERWESPRTAVGDVVPIVKNS